jgi:hypothetical protein
MTVSEANLALQEPLQADCPLPSISCSETEKYRRINGSCNNLENPLWGSTYVALNRELPPEYTAGDEPRGGRDNSVLPSPRHISLTVHKSDRDLESDSVTHMVAQFGQVCLN